MGNTSTFPTIRPLVGGTQGLTITCIAGAAIVPGQVVAIHGTPVANTVWPCVTGTTTMAIGVAVGKASAGEKVAVMVEGVATVCEGAGSGIDAGHIVGIYGTGAAGTVTTITDGADAYKVGVAITDLAANSTGKIMINTGLMIKGA